MGWEQKGFAVVSLVSGGAGMPMVHGFKLTEWEALAQKERVCELPEHLRAGLRVVPATLRFDLVGGESLPPADPMSCEW